MGGTCTQRPYSLLAGSLLKICGCLRVLLKRGAVSYSYYNKSGDLSLCDKARTGRPQTLDDEALQAAIEEDSSQTCGELAKQFNTSSETVRLHLHRLSKTHRRSKWVPHTPLEVHKQQRVAACLSLLSRHHSASILNRVLTKDKKWVLTATVGSDVVQSGRPIFDDFFQHLRPYIGKNTENVVFQMVTRLWLIRIDQ
ncbi:histone-lysine N-methyltransferase SETMAR [Trichonephila clavipes]|nr:histone-lysine N-methyltransferase SETMAR [Trichonephila clavipes]